MPLELTTANPTGVPDPETTTYDNLIAEIKSNLYTKSTGRYDQTTVGGRESATNHVTSSESPIISITEETSKLDLIHISAQSEISPTQIPSIPTATNSYTDTIQIQTKLPNWIPLPNWVKKTTEEPIKIYQTSEPVPESTAPLFESTSKLLTSIKPSFQVSLPTTQVIESTSIISEQVVKPVTSSITTQGTTQAISKSTASTTTPVTTSLTSPVTTQVTTQASTAVNLPVNASVTSSVTTLVTTQVTTPVTISDTTPVTTPVTTSTSQAVKTKYTTRVTSESFPANTQQSVTRQLTSPVNTKTDPVTPSIIDITSSPVSLSTTVLKRTVSGTDISNFDKLNTAETSPKSSVAQPSNTGAVDLEENFEEPTTEPGSITTPFKSAITSANSSIEPEITRTETNQIKPDTTNSTISNNFTISDKQAYNSTAPSCDDCEEHSWFWILAGIAIGGLVFGVICYAMGSCCSQISAAKLSRVESVEESPQTSSQPNSSTNPDLSLYGESY